MNATDSRSPAERAQLIAAAADEARALEIVILQVGKIMPFCDYFVICHGRSPVHQEAICDRVEERLREQRQAWQRRAIRSVPTVPREGHHRSV